MFIPHLVEPEDRFSPILALATELFKAPVVKIALGRDYRHWLPSACSLEELAAMRAQALPEHFHAEADLTLVNGDVAGVLCIMDTKPRPALGKAGARRLRMLARVLSEKLEAAAPLPASRQQVNLAAMAEAMSGVGNWRYELSPVNLTWSDQVYRIHGVDRDSFDPNYNEAINFYHPDDQVTVKALIARAAERQKPFSFQLRILRENDELRHVLCKAECELTDRGATKAIYGVFQDVTASVVAHEAVLRSEARYRRFAENTPDLFIELSAGGRLRYLSPAITAMTGYSLGEVVGRSAGTFIHRHDTQRVLEAFQQAVEDGGGRRIEYKLVRKDSRVIWVEARPSAAYDRLTGEIIGVTDVLRDITAWKAAEAALASSEARYRLLAVNATDMTATFTPRGEISFISPACRQTLGFSPNELIGRTALSMAHPDDKAAFRAYFVELLARGAGGVCDPLQFRCQRKGGGWVWLEGQPKIFFDDITGEPTEVQDVLRDVSVRKALEIELERAKFAAEAATNVKADFLANMSHELRTPLTSILGFTTLAREQSDLTDLTRNYVERVSDASRALLSTVNDILDFSKLEAGQVSICPEPVSLSKLARATLDLFTPQAGAKDLNLVLDSVGEDDGLIVSVDPDRIRQILLNLVSNAVKFTASGSVTLRTRYDHVAETLAIDVIDTGGGIPADKQDCLFKRFSQIDGSLTRVQGGTGLGLAICKGLVEAMGGEIGVESTMGEGSRFWFKMPAPVAADVRAADDLSVDRALSLVGVRVLVVDDHPANRELATLFLSGVGAEISQAADGDEAVRMASSWPYDVILMDVRMPKLDGPSAFRRIRQGEGPNDATPILAFTADADIETAEQLIALGFEGVVAKPLEPLALLEAIGSAIAFDQGHYQEIAHAG